MKKQHKSLAGVFTLSVLALALSNTAHAALLSDSFVGSNGGADNSASSVQATAYPNTAGSPFAGSSEYNITNSRHNLGTKNTLGSNHTPDVLANDGATVIGTNQICVFCHTPHGFNTTQSGPLWNKTVSSSSAYTVYNAAGNISSTLDAATPSIGSVSLACLSCHDGTQAMDNMINAPGFGRQNPNGAGNSGQIQGYTWLELSTLNTDGLSAGGTNSVLVTGVSATDEGTGLGTDLSNDHPISVQYCGGLSDNGAASAYNATTATYLAAGTCGDRNFNLPTMGNVAGSLQFWVDTAVTTDTEAVAAGAASAVGATPITRDPTATETYVGGTYNGDAAGRGFAQTVATGAGVRTKQDLMLFTNNTGVTGPSVECASCHDPHTPNNGTFLRVSNNGSGLCLSCHVK